VEGGIKKKKSLRKGYLIHSKASLSHGNHGGTWGGRTSSCTRTKALEERERKAGINRHVKFGSHLDRLGGKREDGWKGLRKIKSEGQYKLKGRRGNIFSFSRAA